MKKCPYCAEEILDDITICEFCGKSLTKKCPYCAEDIKAEAIVCRWCGIDLVSAQFAPKEKVGSKHSEDNRIIEEKPTSKRLAVTGVLVLVAIILVLIAIDITYKSDIRNFIKPIVHRTPGVGDLSLPRIASREYAYRVYQNNAPALEDIAENTSENGNDTLYTISNMTEDEVVWWTGWCSKNKEILESNVKYIQIRFIINNDRQVPNDTIQFLDQEDKADIQGLGEQDAFCRTYFVVLGDWPVGEFILTDEMIIVQGFNDGWDFYPAGTTLKTSYSVSVIK